LHWTLLKLDSLSAVPFCDQLRTRAAEYQDILKETDKQKDFVSRSIYSRCNGGLTTVAHRHVVKLYCDVVKYWSGANVTQIPSGAQPVDDPAFVAYTPPEDGSHQDKATEVHTAAADAQLARYPPPSYPPKPRVSAYQRIRAALAADPSTRTQRIVRGLDKDHADWMRQHEFIPVAPGGVPSDGAATAASAVRKPEGSGGRKRPCPPVLDGPAARMARLSAEAAGAAAVPRRPGPGSIWPDPPSARSVALAVGIERAEAKQRAALARGTEPAQAIADALGLGPDVPGQVSTTGVRSLRPTRPATQAEEESYHAWDWQEDEVAIQDLLSSEALQVSEEDDCREDWADRL